MRIRLLEQVRSGCKTVAECAAHIQINFELIIHYVSQVFVYVIDNINYILFFIRMHINNN